ncbi:Helicase conserved C-terminal domain-containing protein [Loktanella atrilutea]|uniref:Helicase conserved C-terminal domain-containing protein n=1 Tax=Loktanella atrilutea TaxID=366533 RepID=A0A1M5F0E6_LOKAT|nr:helicase C-terminal domain-containing protein [Loktanella atrilutea]SHF84959.1 Helicase conserved C-terminal domain-containing protein [Loktanella atrilutea]
MTRPDHRPARTALLEIARALLLGPLAADEEIPSAPVDTYVTGILWPEGETLDATEDDQDEGSPSDADGERDQGVPGYRAVRPCSLGLTFAVDDGTTVRVSTAETARYTAVEREACTQGGKPRRMWTRRQLGYQYEIVPGPARTWKVQDFIAPDGQQVSDPSVRLHIRRRIADGRQILTVTLINKAQPTEDRLRDELCLLQSGLKVNAVTPAGQGAIRPRPTPSFAGADEDAQSAALLYRNVLEYAVGHGIAVAWEPTPEQRVASINTTWMPTSVVKGTSASGHPSLVSFLAVNPQSLSAEWLARAGARDEILKVLGGFADVYEAWIWSDLTPRAGDFEGELGTAAGRNLGRCSDALRRIRAGIATLVRDDNAWTAFTLANAAMDRQSRFGAKGDRAGPLTWRPFQLAYFLMVVPGLVDPADADRDDVDLLWFPTGGGKTEAYLGLTAFQILHRRLTDADRRDEGGVDVLMRYTLRLLTVQQFQRAASLICACDAIRSERGDLGDAPITLGLYVGGDATPNRTATAIDALALEHDGQQPKSTPCQLLDCPVCGSALDVNCYKVTGQGTGIDIRCANASCETANKPLPVLTVDDFIYGTPTSLLIGTIDKFAQLPRRRDLRTLFGLDGGLRPGLIIQDELHLISGPLGSMAGLYETVVDMLCTNEGVRPKVIGSTATIGQASRQVRALFDRPVLQFPPSGFEASDSFFAVQDEDGPDRLYVGLCSAGRSPKFALQAGAAALLQGIGYLVSIGTPPSIADPFWTTVLYFNSLRELGGAHILLQDDIPRQIAFLAGRLASQPRILETDAIELSSRVASRNLPDYLGQLSHPLMDGTDPFTPEPRDAVLASNMISVGVDVSRLGLMLVNGQPKSTAEYIQASSRVGRGIDGMVLTLYNFGRPRDISHFEHFLGYHGALYRSVEATSVTPWAPRARDKALHAVVAAAVRHLSAGMDDDSAAADFDAQTDDVLALVEVIRHRARTSSEGVEADDASDDLNAILEEWAMRSQNARASGTELVYWERPAPYGRTKPHLMTSAEEGTIPGALAWPTPNSMREVEPSTAFVLKTMTRRN